MATNYENKKRIFFGHISKISQELDVLFRIPSEIPLNPSNAVSEWQSRSKSQKIFKKAQLSSRCKEIPTKGVQFSSKIECKITRENNEKSNDSNDSFDEALESKRIMVPSGEYLLNKLHLNIHLRSK